MSSDAVISVKNLTKTYRIFGHPGDRIKQALTFGSMRFHREFTALKDVSFEIRKGETVGIIGRNGSGKSTLLQLVCGILKPTSGLVQVNGRVSALLELGAGFNPEFTGRENVYFQGALMGFTTSEMDKRFDDIAAFADIGEFIDQPVRIYSSGMFVRLAFSVAVSVEPDILVVDEALAVGDAGFQSKCFGRIRKIRDEGGTILLVTHATDQVVKVCNQAIFLDGGEVVTLGPPNQIVAQFHKLLHAPVEKRGHIIDQARRSIPVEPELLQRGESDIESSLPDGCALYANDDEMASYDPEVKSRHTVEYESNGALIESPAVTTLAGRRVNILSSGKVYRYEYTVRFERDASNVRFGMLIKTMDGIELGGATSASKPTDGVRFIPTGSLVRIEFRFDCRLNPGIYFLNAGVTGDIAGTEHILHRLVDVEAFRVLPRSGNTATALIDFSCQSEIHFILPPPPVTS